ncbi:MAG: hypothetical protein ACREQ5_25835, partial [Candidatus Dormibacteria bacterium]
CGWEAVMRFILALLLRSFVLSLSSVVAVADIYIVNPYNGVEMDSIRRTPGDIVTVRVYDNKINADLHYSFDCRHHYWKMVDIWNTKLAYWEPVMINAWYPIYPIYTTTLMAKIEDLVCPK